MRPDTIPELIMWLGAVGAVALLIGALIIGPAVYRWRLRRMMRRLRERAELALAESAQELPELSELLARAFDESQRPL